MMVFFAAWGVIPKWNVGLEEKIDYSLKSVFEIFEWFEEYQKYIKEEYKQYGLKLGNLAIGMTLGDILAGIESNMNSWEYKLSGDIIIKAGRLTKKPNYGELWVNQEFVKAIKEYKLDKNYNIILLDKEINIQIKDT